MLFLFNYYIIIFFFLNAASFLCFQLEWMTYRRNNKCPTQASMISVSYKR